MWLRKTEGGASVGPYSWPEDGAVCEVPGDLGDDLLRLGGYEMTGAPEAGGGEAAAKPKRAARGKPAATEA